MDKNTIGGIPKRNYMTIHKYIQLHYSKPKKCQNKHCPHPTGKKLEWALKKGRQYSKHINDYLALCVSCHRKYDFTEATRKRLSDSHKGKPCEYQWRAVLKLHPTSGRILKKYPSIKKAALANEVLHTSIANVLAGRSKYAKGFKWAYA